MRGTPEGKLRQRAGHLKRKYGITIEQYDAMLEAQGGGCFICGRPPREDISLHVDHDHFTGEIRGILCFRCNNALADFQEDPILLAKAAAYPRSPDPRRRDRAGPRAGARAGRAVSPGVVVGRD
jgi:hypothetical protein